MPSAKAVVGVNVQLPEASVVAVPKGVVPCKMLTVLFGSAVPAIAPLVLPEVVMVGTVGAVPSIVRLTGLEAPEILPAASLAVAVKA